MVVGKDYSALRASPFGSLPAATLSLALESNLGRSFSSLPAWAEYLIADSLESSGTFESDGGGEGLLSAARFALRVVACGNALSLALESNLGRSFSSFPAWAEYLITDSFESSGTFESDGGGEGFEPSKSMTADLQSAPFGRSGTPPGVIQILR